jgi:predicted dehydrogenase
MKYGKLRVALIGAGQIAEVTHLPVLSQMNDRVELVGIADPAVERAVMLSSRFGIDNTFGD